MAKFIEVHCNKEKRLVNLDWVEDIWDGDIHRYIYFAFNAPNACEQDYIKVDESHEEIARKIADIDRLVQKQATSDWIPVAERLPERKGSYLVCSAKGCVCTAHWYASRWSHEHLKITHWMEMPMPPREKDNA